MSKGSLLCCWALALFFSVCLPAQTPHFERLGAAEGLSQGMIFDLLQDRNGFLWFATKDGLNRYDGYSFQVFQNNPFDPFSISDNEIQCLLEDREGRIWVGTANNGLDMLDPQTGKFYHLNNLSTQSILRLAQTTDGSIWAGTASGVNRVRVPALLPLKDPSLESSVKVDTFFWNDGGAGALTTSHRIVDLAGSRDGKLWVSTYLQVGFFDIATSQFHKVWTNPDFEKGDFLSSFFQEGPDGAMWVGQPGQLLRVRGSSEITVFRLPETSMFPHTDLAFDAAGNMFVSTRKQIFRLPAAQLASPELARFDLFYRFPHEGIIGSTQLAMDRGGLLWVGTNGYGLLKYNPGNRHFHHYLHGKSPRRIFTDNQQRVWVWHTATTFRQLLLDENRSGALIYSGDDLLHHDCIQAKDGRIWLLCESPRGKKSEGVLLQLNEKTLRLEARYPTPISIGMYSRLAEGPDGKLWVLGSKSTLLKFDPRTSEFVPFDFSAVTGFKEISLSLSFDANGQLWIGTPHGLVQAVPEGAGLKFLLHKNLPNNRQSLNCNFVLSSLNDPAQPERYCWIGTKGGGLNLFDKRRGTCRHFTTAEGLPNNVVYAILPDEQGALWLSTNCGLSKFDPATGVFQNFFNVDGLQDNEFNTLSFARATDGRLYFGGVNGVTAFYPSELNPLAFANPPVFITRLKINNQPASVGSGDLEKNIEHTRSLTLSHQQNQLTFEFAAMDFSAPRMNQFRYRLLGADRDWVESTTSNAATYAHLAPGDYVFEVVTGGSRGVWNGAPARLEIRILPPWWRTYWAYALYALVFALSAWWFYRFQMNKIRLENKLAFEHREALRLAELDRLKTNFFSSVTHEFRTPLTLLLEPARQLLADAKDRAVRYRLELIENNARRLLQFVNQLLDLSKLEAGQMPLDLRPGNPADTLRAVAERFQPLALQHSIRLQVELPDDPISVVFDENKWEQVLSNLLSNAVKFTEKGGSVTLKLDVEKTDSHSKKNFRLEVADTGVGISPEDLARVFDRFYQASPPAPLLMERGEASPPAPLLMERGALAGTGIGLSLTKELVERMGGSISVESSVGIGTAFTVNLPCEVAAMQQVNVRDEETPLPETASPEPWVMANQSPIANHQSPISNEQSAISNHHPLLLLIEDDTELRQFLRASLPTGYRIAEAADGAEGIQMAIELVPDLVISDLVMPQKDGFEVAETLKNDPSTSHIPLILLTAKSAIESKMQGLRRGADVYLTKPFRADELVAHIENLLASRQRLQAHFSQSAQNKTVAESAVAALPAQESEFLQRLIQVVEENLDNEAMDADAFARMVFVSRSQLHRKISALTGMPLTEFVRNHRLDRARVMLAQREGSISEIAWRTGFPNAKYFSTCFKERFGKSPSGFVSG
ncbi:MAG: two-component regulator propeller domain-containing protein [Saprospiraceae bacterium]